MSHLTTVAVEIHDLQALQEAASKRGLVYEEAETFVFEGRRGNKCFARIIQEGTKSEMIGIIKQGDSYSLKTSPAWKKKGQALAETYTAVLACKTAKAYAEQNGYTYMEQLDENGELEVVLTQY